MSVLLQVSQLDELVSKLKKDIPRSLPVSLKDSTVANKYYYYIISYSNPSWKLVLCPAPFMHARARKGLGNRVSQRNEWRVQDVVNNWTFLVNVLRALQLWMLLTSRMCEINYILYVLDLIDACKFLNGDKPDVHDSPDPLSLPGCVTEGLGTRLLETVKPVTWHLKFILEFESNQS